MIRQYAASCSQHRLLTPGLVQHMNLSPEPRRSGGRLPRPRSFPPTESVRNSARAGLPRNCEPAQGIGTPLSGLPGRVRRMVRHTASAAASERSAATPLVDERRGNIRPENSQSSCHRDGRRSSGTWFFSSAIVNGLSALGHPKVSFRRPFYRSMLLSWNEGRRPSSTQGTHETAEKSIGRRELQSIRTPIANFGKTQTTTSH